jgi:para-nitrobenzyl esterase
MRTIFSSCLLLSLLFLSLRGDADRAFAQSLALDEYESFIEDAVVTTNKGTLRGTRGALTRRFLGIPYATPPIGDLRWKPPAAMSSWSEKSALAFGHRCPQLPTRPDDSEDCLYLNLFAPSSMPTGTAYPVMFYIHGGGFLGGDILDMGLGLLLNGAYLAAYQNVIVVTVNYRVGALGFLTHESLAGENALGVSGNYGLLDILAALDWVQTEIDNFGGDPQRVTIFGHSAGASAACALLVSPLAKGKFSGAIVQSGWCGAARMAERIAAGHKVAESLGCFGTDSGAATCLRKLTPGQILQKVGSFKTDY